LTKNSPESSRPRQVGGPGKVFINSLIGWTGAGGTKADPKKRVGGPGRKAGGLLSGTRAGARGIGRFPAGPPCHVGSGRARKKCWGRHFFAFRTGFSRRKKPAKRVFSFHCSLASGRADMKKKTKKNTHPPENSVSHLASVLGTGRKKKNGGGGD